MADPPHDDAALLQCFLSHQDEVAFGELVRRHGPLVWGVCRRRLDRLEDAEDTFQTTFLILAIKAGTIRQPGTLASWLHRTATRVARRVATRSPRMPVDEQHDAGLDALAEMTKREMISAVDDELQALPGRYRDALVLFHLEGRTRQDVARRLGVSEPTIKARLSRGRSLLRSRLARRGVALPLLLPLAADPLPAGAAESAMRLAGTFGRTRVTPGDLFTTTLTQGANPMLSLITGKTGLAVLAVCLGLTVVWAVRDPLRAGDEEGRGVPVIDTELDAQSQTNDSSLALLDDGGAISEPAVGPETDDPNQPVQNAGQTQLEPADPVRLNAEERKIFEELSKPTRVEFTGIPLRDALTALGTQHQIQIVFDQAAIEEEGVTVDTNVDLFLNGITLGSALDLMLEPDGLDYYVDNEVLMITSGGVVSSNTATRAYHIPPAGGSRSSDDVAEKLQAFFSVRGLTPTPVIQIFGDRLLMNGTIADHKHLQDILRLIYEESERHGDVQTESGDVDLLQTLDRIIDRLDYTGNIPLRDALQNMSIMHEFDLDINEEAIEAAGLSVENGVDLVMDDITVRSALSLLLKPEGLGFAVEDDVLHILPSESHMTRAFQPIIKLYPVTEFSVGKDRKQFAQKIERRLRREHRPIKIAAITNQIDVLMPQLPKVAVVDEHVVIVGTISDHDLVAATMLKSNAATKE